MIDSSEKRNRQLAFELQNSHVCEKRSKAQGKTQSFKRGSTGQLLYYPIEKFSLASCSIISLPIKRSV